jgi:hypothetical protein
MTSISIAEKAAKGSRGQLTTSEFLDKLEGGNIISIMLSFTTTSKLKIRDGVPLMKFATELLWENSTCPRYSIRGTCFQCIGKYAIKYSLKVKNLTE